MKLHIFDNDIHTKLEDLVETLIGIILIIAVLGCVHLFFSFVIRNLSNHT